MREIEFRGLDCKSGKWVYGDVIHGVGHRGGEIFILPRVKNLATIPNCDPLDGVKVKPETVGQYTGFKDMRGNKIFEGDTFKVANCKGIVVWDIEKASFMIEFWFNNKKIQDKTTLKECFDIYIVDNIHETKTI